MNQIAKRKIRKVYYLGSVSAVLLVAFTFSLVFIESLNNEHNEKIEQLATGITNEKKRFLENAVERTIYLIESERLFVQKSTMSQRLRSDQIDQLVIDNISEKIRNLRLIDDGYIWVNKIVNYEGGENYAIRLIHPNLPHTEGSWLSTDTTDVKGNRPYEIELHGIKKNGELFFEYYFQKLQSNEVSHKMSYAKLYRPYDWIIATGVYLDDVDKLIEIETHKMQETHSQQFFIAMMIAGCVTLISIVILAFFEKQISALIEHHEQEIKERTDHLFTEHERTVQALAEVRQLKGMLPICSSCKKIRDDKGYWNQIESYIQEHSDASFTHGYCPNCYAKELGKIETWRKSKGQEGLDQKNRF